MPRLEEVEERVRVRRRVNIPGVRPNSGSRLADAFLPRLLVSDGDVVGGHYLLDSGGGVRELAFGP